MLGAWAILGIVIAPDHPPEDGEAAVGLHRREGAGTVRPVGSVAVVAESVHNRLRQLRIERGVTRRDLADALGIHYQTVGYLERGEYSPSLYLALGIAAYFDLPVETIFSLEAFPVIGAREVDEP